MTTIDLSEPAASRPQWWRPVLVWTAATLVYALTLFNQIGLPFPTALRSSAVYVYSLAILIIPAQRFARRSFEGRWPRAPIVVGHTAFGIATVGAWFGVNVLSDRLTLGPDFWELIYAHNWLFQLLFAITAYGTAIGLTIAATSWRRERDRERREAALLLQARDAELGAIRTQLQPHFVMNALNSVLALIDQDPSKARTMVVRLADVMREVFDRADHPTVPLSRELELLRAYLDVEQIRFATRLAVTFDIDANATDIDVPALLLQPIVENAVKHGIAPYPAGGRVQITARRAGTRLLLTVRDTGQDPPTESTGTGRGLELTRRRLNTAYGDQAALTLNHDAGGTEARIDMPIVTHGL